MASCGLRPSSAPSRLRRQKRSRHRVELDARYAVQRDIIEVDRAAARSRTAVLLLIVDTLLLCRLGLLIAPGHILGHAFLRVAGHDFVARLEGAIGQLERIGQPIGPRQPTRDVVGVYLLDPEIDGTWIG